MNKPREEEKEIERALAGGKVYQIREVKKLLDQALSQQRAEILEKIEDLVIEEPWEGLDPDDKWDYATGMVREGGNQALSEVKKIIGE